MKRVSTIVKLIFGVLGALYAVVGVIGLTLATRAAGDIRRIFTIPEEELAFAICGCVFTALGVIFLLVALLTALADMRRARLRDELLTYGARVTGRVVDVRTDYTIRVNRRSPVIATVRCDFPTGEVTLKSHRLWDASPAAGDKAEVIYDPMDEKRYVIEFAEGI